MVRNGDLVHWGPIFIGDLTEVEEQELFSMLDVIGQVTLVGKGPDMTLWKPFMEEFFRWPLFF